MATQPNEENRSEGPGRTSNQGQKEASGGEKDPAGKIASNEGGSKAATNTSRGGGKNRSSSNKKSGDNLPSRRK